MMLDGISLNVRLGFRSKPRKTAIFTKHKCDTKQM